MTSTPLVSADPSAASHRSDPARRGPDGRLLNPTMVAKRRAKPSWWIGGAVLAVLVLGFVLFLVTNENLRWPVVGEFLFDSRILAGLVMTLQLTLVAMVLGLVIGVVLAVMRLSGNPVFRAASWAWIWFFRGVPPLVQLVFWYNLALLLPRVELGVPFGPTFASWDTNELITPLSAAVLGLALTESAYAAEMIRAGIQAVSVGQSEAAASLGLTRGATLRRIILPQALRIIIPPIGNDTISMLKFTSLVSVLALPDLLFSAQQIYSRNYQTIPLLIVATLWYLVLTTVLTIGEHALEKRLSRAHRAVTATVTSPWTLRSWLPLRTKETS